MSGDLSEMWSRVKEFQCLIETASLRAPEDQTIVHLDVATSLFQMLLPEANDDFLIILGEKLKEQRSRDMEGRSKGLSDLDVRSRCVAIAAVRFFAAKYINSEQMAKAKARSHVGKLLGLKPTALKNYENQWMKRPTRAKGGGTSHVSHGSIIPEDEVTRLVAIVEQAERNGDDPEILIRNLYDDN